MRSFAMLTIGLALLAAAGCARVKVDPIEVKTIHIVHDVNIRVDQQLDDFFAFQEQQQRSSTQPSTAPAAAPTASATGDVQP